MSNPGRALATGLTGPLGFQASKATDILDAGIPNPNKELGSAINKPLGFKENRNLKAEEKLLPDPAPVEPVADGPLTQRLRRPGGRRGTILTRRANAATPFPFKTS